MLRFGQLHRSFSKLAPGRHCAIPQLARQQLHSLFQRPQSQVRLLRFVLLKYLGLNCFQRVNAIDMSPADDTFLTGAADDSVRLWDLRTPTCQVSLVVMVNPKGQ